MRLLRLLVAGLIALAAMAAVALAAVVVFLTGFAALVVQAFRVKPPAARPPGPGRRSELRTDDAIDVVTTRVSDEADGP